MKYYSLFIYERGIDKGICVCKICYDEIPTYRRMRHLVKIHPNLLRIINLLFFN